MGMLQSPRNRQKKCCQGRLYSFNKTQLFPSDMEDEISKTKPFMETTETKSPKQSIGAEKVTASFEKSPSSVVPLWNLISCCE
ncbi:hypothetical protein A4A49_55916 [Nicotiana attenuata]|uniref:Uncharacterized protein n=1 Tax=Nicotiana attenuata TaxID=49451 RepID=A0A1J6K4Q9_NICAT|nr:hypothetical protein A4A49_55916 [Nicotiana attenuata]